MNNNSEICIIKLTEYENRHSELKIKDQGNIDPHRNFSLFNVPYKYIVTHATFHHGRFNN